MRLLKLGILALALTACAGAAGNGSRATASSGHEAATADSNQARPGSSKLTGDACTAAGYWTFFEAFVRSADVRESYTNASAREAIDPFRIVLVDNAWYYVADQSAQPSEMLELKEQVSGDEFRVDYVRAKIDSEGEVTETYGEPGRYVFRHLDGCWRLVQSTP